MSNRELRALSANSRRGNRVALKSKISKQPANKIRNYIVAVKAQLSCLALPELRVYGFEFCEDTIKFMDNPAKGLCYYLIFGTEAAYVRLNRRKHKWLVSAEENIGCLYTSGH